MGELHSPQDVKTFHIDSDAFSCGSLGSFRLLPFGLSPPLHGQFSLPPSFCLWYQHGQLDRRGTFRRLLAFFLPGRARAELRSNL